MAQKTLAGTPAIRYPDPLVRRVNPNGTQPYTAYRASLFYFLSDSAYVVLSAPPEFLFVELLLFGADYAVQVAGTQEFTGYYNSPTYEGEIFDAAGAPIPFRDLALPLGGFPSNPGVETVSTILTDAPPVSYKKIATGKTATNGVTVSGFPHLSIIPSRNLWQTPAGDTGERASYLVTYDVILNGATVDGPALFLSQGGGGGTLPIILWEPDLTQKIVDDGYIVDVLGDGTAVFDVVGLWASAGYSPLGPGIGARSFGAPPTIAPTSPLSYISPAMAEAAAAYAALK
jgi:hypothetical protein